MPTQPLRPIPLEIQINGTAGGLWPVLERDGAFYVPDEAFAAWRLDRGTEAESLEFRGLRYTSVASLPGIHTALDGSTGVLNLTVSAQAFATTRMSRQLEAVAIVDPSVPSLFLNYDISASSLEPRGRAGSRSLGMAGELGFSNEFGVLTSSFVGQAVSAAQAEQRSLIRLNTTFRRDLPAERLTLSLGDSATRTGYLGRPAYFAGIQIGTNFGLAPGFNRNPIPVINGETRAPSTVQLYIDNVLRQTVNVPSGPFTLDTLPVLTGNGNVSVVVRDLLGRETVINQPFFVTSDLLAPGLNDWSAEAGRLRLNLGASSNDYGDSFAAGVWRRGLSTTMTVEGRAERTRDLATVGGSAIVALGGRYVARAGVSASDHTAVGAGRRWVAGMDWQDRAHSVIVGAEANSRGFRELGQSGSMLPVKWQLTGQATTHFGAYGRVGAGVVARQGYEGRKVSVLSLSHSVELSNRWLVTSSYTRAFGASRTGYNLRFSLNIPLGPRTSAAVATQFRPDGVDTTLSIAQSPSGAYGTGWRLMSAHQDRLRAEGGAYHFGPNGIVSGEVSVAGDQVSVRTGASGSVLFAGGKLAALQRHDTSAVLVEVPGYAGVGVGLGGRASTTTDANGVALITGLSPYQGNPVQLAANDLPITAEIENIEQMTVPGARSVSRVTFKVRGGRGALVRILLEDGEAAPAGSVVRVAGEDREYLVSRRGDAYVTGLKTENAAQLTWKGKSCPLVVSLPPGTADDIARVGPLVCKEVIR